jgi:ribosomal protein S18 acetylase RimI-like enzyme
VITVRLAVLAEVDVLRDLTRRAYQHYVPRIGLEPAPMGADFARLVDAGTVWVATEDPAIEGTAILGLIVLEPGPEDLLIENVAVSPSAQGRGIGGRLMVLAEEEAIRRGLGALTLYTHELMTENLAFYARRGYTETHRAKQGAFSRVFLRKPLPVR